ncbi:MAG TPA: 50S ribosomal protein L18 [Polyangiales bacterium]
MAANEESRLRRKRRIRKKVNGSAERPRVSVFRSSKHIYVQAIDDSKGVTLATVSTLSTDLKSSLDGTKSDDAKAVGTQLAKVLKDKGIESIVFDRNGYLYHGRVKALAEGAREAGLKF